MEKLDGKTVDVVQDNIEQLKQLFPEVFTEDKIMWDRLQQALGEHIATDKERYDFTWNGKTEAIQLAQKQTSGTLRPCKEESVNWETTQNLYIEGDNLEVLRLLQNSYRNKVKMIYIDPPYNTGKDFIYKDNFIDNIKNYKEQIDSRYESNVETNGRYHTNWLNMMYPRLKIAKNLLKDDGVIFVSISDSEIDNLTKMMKEIFGEENFIGNFIWKSRQNKDNRNATMVSIDHEYVLCFGKKLKGANRDLSQYSNPDNDSKGEWTSANMVGLLPQNERPNLHYDLINPETGINYGKPDMGWRYDKNTMQLLIAENKVIWPGSPSGRPRRKVFLNELKTEYTGFSTIIGNNIFTRNGTEDILELFNQKIWQFPKPVELLCELFEQGLGENDILLDFFSGSGTSAQALFHNNILKQSSNRFILVQIPETVGEDTPAYKEGFKTLCAISKERIIRAGKKVIEDNREKENIKNLDIGFKVFKLDETNLKTWDEHTESIQDSLLDSIEPIKEGRTHEDVVYEVLLKYGFDLTVPIEEKEIAGVKVYSVGVGYLFICLETELSLEQVETIAKEKPSRMIFYDDSFKTDVVRTNAQQILQRYGVEDIRIL